MAVADVRILDEALADLEAGQLFYEQRQRGLGTYFWDSLLADLESLVIYGGVHTKVCGFYQMFSKRFPYAIYYDIDGVIAYVVAVLPMRRDPQWMRRALSERNRTE